MINYLNAITWVNKLLWLANKTDHFVLQAFFGVIVSRACLQKPE